MTDIVGTQEYAVGYAAECGRRLATEAMPVPYEYDIGESVLVSMAAMAVALRVHGDGVNALLRGSMRDAADLLTFPDVAPSSADGAALFQREVYLATMRQLIPVLEDETEEEQTARIQTVVDGHVSVLRSLVDNKPAEKSEMQATRDFLRYAHKVTNVGWTIKNTEIPARRLSGALQAESD